MKMVFVRLPVYMSLDNLFEIQLFGYENKLK
jgi:hypothetical protein